MNNKDCLIQDHQYHFIIRNICISSLWPCNLCYLNLNISHMSILSLEFHINLNIKPSIRSTRSVSTWYMKWIPLHLWEPAMLTQYSPSAQGFSLHSFTSETRISERKKYKKWIIFFAPYKFSVHARSYIKSKLDGANSLAHIYKTKAYMCTLTLQLCFYICCNIFNLLVAFFVWMDPRLK